MPEELYPVRPPQSQEGMTPPEEIVFMDEQPEEETPTSEDAFKASMQAYIDTVNIADDLDDKVLDDIGIQVVKDFDIDNGSLVDWKKRQKIIFELVDQLTESDYEEADIHYPTLAAAALQFAARAYFQIIKGREVVKSKLIGSVALPRKDKLPQVPEEEMTPELEEMIKRIQTELDEKESAIKEKKDRGERIAECMNYQILEENKEWESDFDQLLISLALVGCVFKKTYMNQIEDHFESELVQAKDLVINYFAKSVEKASRVTHVFELTPNEIEERVRVGIFLDIELGDPQSDEEKKKENSDDKDRPHIFYEQHRFWDLDLDHYQEPYVVTVHKDTQKVVRIVARFDVDGIVVDETGKILRIKPVHYFTRFLFMPAFDGNIYGMGYGGLLSPLNDSINTTINQLTDAATFAVRPSGWIAKGIKLISGSIARFKPSEWKPTTYTGDDLRKGIVPNPTKEPSRVSMNLLTMMIEASKELSSTADILTGESMGARESPTTVMALIEQALTLFGTVYKRLHRSLKAEFGKIRRLNRLFLGDEKYQVILDIKDASVKDFYEKDVDIVPVSDEAELTRIQKVMKAEMLKEWIGTGMNDNEIKRRILESVDTPDIPSLMPKEGEPTPMELAEQEKVAQEKRKLDQEDRKLDLEEKRIDVDRKKVDAEVKIKENESREKISKLMSETDKNIVDTHTKGLMSKLDDITRKIEGLTKEAEIDKIDAETDKIVVETNKTDAEIEKIGAETDQIDRETEEIGKEEKEEKE